MFSSGGSCHAAAPWVTLAVSSAKVSRDPPRSRAASSTDGICRRLDGDDRGVVERDRNGVYCRDRPSTFADPPT